MIRVVENGNTITFPKVPKGKICTYSVRINTSTESMMDFYRATIIAYRHSDLVLDRVDVISGFTNPNFLVKTIAKDSAVSIEVNAEFVKSTRISIIGDIETDSVP